MRFNKAAPPRSRDDAQVEIAEGMGLRE